MSRALVLPLPPSTNNLYVNARGRGRILSKAGREYKQAVRVLALGARLPLLRGDVVLTMTVYFPNRRRRDLDNTLKVCLDSLSGVAYADDSQVSELHLYRAYDSGNPRAELVIGAATDTAREAA